MAGVYIRHFNRTQQHVIDSPQGGGVDEDSAVAAFFRKPVLNHQLVVGKLVGGGQVAAGFPKAMLPRVMICDFAG